MTHEIDLLTLKTKFDSSGFDEMEKAATDSVASVKKDIESLGKTDLKLNVASFKAAMAAIEKEIVEIDKRLDDLTKERAIKLKAPNWTAATKGEFEKLEQRIADLTKEREIKVGMQQAGVREVQSGLEKIKNGLNNLTTGASSAANALAASATATQRQAAAQSSLASTGTALAAKNAQVSASNAALATSTNTLAAAQTKAAAAVKALVSGGNGLPRLGALLGGPLGIAIGAAAASFFDIAAAESEAEKSAKKYGYTLEALEKSYLNIQKEAKGATEKTKEFAEALEKRALAQIENAQQKINLTVKELKETSEAIDRIIHDMGVDIEVKYDFKVPEIRDANTELQKLVASLKENGENAEEVAEGVSRILVNLNTMGLNNAALKQSKDFAKFEASANGVYAALLNITGELQRVGNGKGALELDEVGKQAKAEKDALDKAFKDYGNTVQGKRELYKREIQDAKNLVAAKQKILASGNAAEAAEAKDALDKLSAVLTEREQRYQKFEDDLSKKGTKKSASGGGKTDRLKGIEAEYKTQLQIADALIKDEQRLADARLSIDARYYADKEKILRDQYARQAEQGKEVTAEQIRQLEEVAQKARETARDSGLREIEASYQARMELAQQVAGVESALEAAGFEDKKKYLEEKLALLTRNAEESIRLTGKVEEAEIEAIRRTKDEIMRVQVEGAKQNYETRVALARATFSNEYDLEKELLDAKKDMLRQQLDAMLKAAAEQMALGGQVSAQLIADIKRVRDELKEALDQKPMIDQVKDMAQQFSQYLGGMVDQLSSFFSQQYDNAIKAAERQYKQMSKALDLQLKQQLKEIDDNLKAQREMYEQQLKDLAEIEKEKTKLTDKYTEKRADLLEQMQETMTEEEYDALQAQLEEEQAKYEESLAALDEDNLTREEIEAAKEQAELEAQARKEQAEAEHLAAMEKLQKDYASKMAKLEQQKAMYEKAAGVVKAIISTATGVAQALSYGWPMGPIFAAIVGAMGAVQIATIVGQSPPAPPSFRQGGTVGADNAHLYTMVPPPPDPRDKTLIWASRDEEVLNPAESEIYRALEAAGFSLSDALYAAHDAAGGAVGAVIDNSRRVVQHNTFEVKESMSYCEARRYARKMQDLGWRLA